MIRSQSSWGRLRWVQPLLAFVLLAILCVKGVFEDRQLNIAGHILGEGSFSLYNLMLVGSALVMFLRARRLKQPALAWRVWDLTLCCMIASWGLKGALWFLPRPSGGPNGFPSGHTLTAFAAAWLLMETVPGVAPFAFAVAVAVGWSRVEIHEHFTYQVIGGAMLGMLIGWAVTHARLAGRGVLLPRLARRDSTPRSH